MMGIKSCLPIFTRLITCLPRSFLPLSPFISSGTSATQSLIGWSVGRIRHIKLGWKASPAFNYPPRTYSWTSKSIVGSGSMDPALSRPVQSHFNISLFWINIPSLAGFPTFHSVVWWNGLFNGWWWILLVNYQDPAIGSLRELQIDKVSATFWQAFIWFYRQPLSHLAGSVK